MSYPIGVMAARFLLSWKDMRRCWLFVLLSITSGAVPALAVAMFSFEVPALFSKYPAADAPGRPMPVCFIAKRVKQISMLRRA